MGIFHRTKVITIDDYAKKERIQEIFAQHHIEYKMKVKEILQKNPIDTAVIGTLGMHKRKISYSFYGEKENADAAKDFLQG